MGGRVVRMLLLIFSTLMTSTVGLTYLYADGSRYEGQVNEKGQPVGLGLMYNSTGELVYNGSFVDGNWDGEGVWHGQSGEIYKGNFKGGRAHGFGMRQLVGGERIEGTFREVGLEGPAVWYWANGKKRMEGEFLRGVVHGKATYYLDNGTRFIGLFRKGVPHGRALVIGEDGKQVWEGSFYRGRPERQDLELELLDTTNELRLRRMSLQFSD